MKVGQSWRTIVASVAGVIALVGMSRVAVMAQAVHTHPTAAPQQAGADDERKTDKRWDPNNLLDVVRKATGRFADVAVAEAEGYSLQFGCVSGPDSGAMGLHYVNPEFVGDGELDPYKPEIIIYEPLPNGRLKLVGADFLVLAEGWDAKQIGPPQLMGQLLHLFEAPNRFGLPSFYTLHVWAWKDNPTGAFVNWHSKISCDSFPVSGR